MENLDKIIKRSGLSADLLTEITDIAKKYSVERLIIFGSRARGDYHRTSDIDLAVIGGSCIEFALDTDETTSTLLKFDIVCLDKPVQQELINSINTEGLILYEKV